MRELDRDIETAARSHAKVLITGETGVGKEVVARLIHQRSSRSQRADGRHQLRRHPRFAARIGVIRSRPRQLYRRVSRQAGPV